MISADTTTTNFQAGSPSPSGGHVVNGSTGVVESMGAATAAAGFVEPIAVVGMAMRLPGQVRDGKDFWNLLVEKRNGLCRVPKDRFNVEGFHDPSGKPDTMKMDKAYYLEDIDSRQFDPSMFSMSKAEVERLDPQQRQLLEVAYECMEDSGATSWRGSKIGCYVGAFGEDWQDICAKELQQTGGSRLIGYNDLTLANRISYEFNLRGPSMTVKTGCSSSLVCLDLACDAIRKGDCEGALVCGTSMILSPALTSALEDYGVLSPTGTCKTFDAAADGYGRGEAINAVYLKNLAQALRDGDSIRAVIRGTSVNCDGKTQGMSTPSPVAQEALIRRAYKRAGIEDLSRTAFVECHGTGTKIGDPMETLAVGRCFGEKGITITSVKPNVGHSEGAAGLTSLIKAILAVEHRQVPPNIFFNTPNPQIPFEEYNLRVPTQLEKWPKDRAERVSVNSFGVGGVNAHAVVESLAQYEKSFPGFCHRATHGIRSVNQTNGDGHLNGNENAEPMALGSQKQLLLISSNTEASLAKMMETYNEYTLSSTEDFRDVSFTLANRRDHGSHRAYAIVERGAVFEPSPSEAAKTLPSIGLIFTGQGAQWAGMGAGLIDSNVVFQGTMRKLDRMLASLPQPPSWTIEGELRKSAEESRVQKAEFGHPLCVAVQIGLVDVLQSWNVKPDFVLGHSSGEMGAAYASGALTAEAAMAAAFFRGATSKSGTCAKQGSMAAIGLGSHEMEPYMEPGVVIACENSQSSVTVSGDSEQVKKVVTNVKEQRPEVLARMLRVEKAFHSPHMLEFGPMYEEAMQPYVTSVPPTTPFFSSVTGREVEGDNAVGPKYWRQNMENPVLFNQALRSALKKKGDRVLLIEIGPHPALKGPVAQILRDLGRKEDVQVGTLSRGRSCQTSLLHLTGRLFQQGLALDYQSICPPGKNVHTLPRHAWKEDCSLWVEPRLCSDWRFRTQKPHELLGARVTEISGEMCWRNKLSLQDVPWLLGHEIDGQVVFPGAGYLGMIGEALRQLEGVSTFTMRNVSIKAGLVLEHGQPVELVTTLTAPIVDADETASYTFSISSFNGHGWTKHCIGEAMASVDKSMSLTVPEVTPLPRCVDKDYWYEAMKIQGGNYTGIFRGLQDISASPSEDLAFARISAKETNVNRNYSMHPAILDQCLHSITVAVNRGLGRNFDNFAVPTFIEEAIIGPTPDDFVVTAAISSSKQSSFIAEVVAQQGSKLVMSLKGFQSTAINGKGQDENGARLISHIDWKPHADFVPLSDSVSHHEFSHKVKDLLEELTLLCCLDHVECIKLPDDAPSHIVKMFTWMRGRVDHYKSGSNCLVSKDLELWKLSKDQRQARIRDIRALLYSNNLVAITTANQRLFEAAESIFAGQTHALHVLMKDGILTELYNEMDTIDCSDVIKTLAHTNPKLRVLEIGAGTGGVTAQILQSLVSSDNERMYGGYTYTDISAGFFTAAQERFAKFDKIEYAVCDISKDVVEQGFEEGGFDLIIGANVVHATPSIHVSLKNLRRLLSPNGKLMLVEINSGEIKFLSYIMGFLSGWWLGDADDRKDEPLISAERWTEELSRVGLTISGSITQDDIFPYNLNSCIIASPEIRHDAPSEVALLCHSADGQYYDEIKASLEARGVSVVSCLFGQPLPSSTNVISVLDLQSPLLHDMTNESFKHLVGYMTTTDSKIFWAMPSCQASCEDPRAAMTLGLARTARNERALKIYTVEIDGVTSHKVAAESLCDILLQASSASQDGRVMDPDWEYAIVNGKVHIPRLHWKTMSDALAQIPGDDARPGAQATTKKLMIEKPGLLHTMGWDENEVQSLEGDQVLIQNKVVGLNFRDVLTALGVLDDNFEDLGFEGSGIIIGTGPGVKALCVGDQVIYLGNGCFTSSLVMREANCVKVDKDLLTFEQGAAIPCVYGTAAAALVDKANLQRGQTVLIHSACGGVGLAAVQMAKMLGAEIYCTVGSEEKVRYLVEHHGIPRSHIFHSRDASFLGDVMRATNQVGVDVVLNSLSGSLLHASWKCVAEFGTMIEIGKRDFRRRAKLAMDIFEQNRSFVGLDLGIMLRQRPEMITSLLKRCVDWIKTGAIQPGKIANIWEANEIQDAFRSMQSGTHIGKMVIRMSEDVSTLAPSRAPREMALRLLRPDRSYLLIGGLGGVGRAVASWMVEHGARHIIFLSRSAKETPELQKFKAELAAQGCEVQLAAGSVAEMGDVERAVANAAKPIAGMINLSMVLRDNNLTNMSFEDWTAVVGPKVQGTWNLHRALMGSELDFFILCSSIGGMCGQWGQSNYAAANTFLDAFAHYRQAQGLAASVIDIGAVGDVGVLTKSQEIRKAWSDMGGYLLREREVVDAMALAMQPGARQFILGLATTVPIDSPKSRMVWKTDMRMSIYHNVSCGGEGSGAGTEGTSGDGAQALMAAMSAHPEMLTEEETAGKIAKTVTKTLERFLIREEDSITIEQPVEAMGVDSLVAMELRNWIRQMYGVEMNVMSIVRCGSALRLSDHVRQKLIERLG